MGLGRERVGGTVGRERVRGTVGRERVGGTVGKSVYREFYFLLKII